MVHTTPELIAAFSHNVAGKRDVAVESVLILLVYLSTGLRLWSRRLQKSSLQINDYLILAAVVSLFQVRFTLLSLNLKKKERKMKKKKKKLTPLSPF